MKNIILIACTVVITFTLAAFTSSNWNCSFTHNSCSQPTKVIEPPNFFYSLSSRCKNTITKERMHNAKTISDLMPDFRMQENLKNNITSLRDVKIRFEEENAHNTKQRIAKGNGNTLSKEQITLFKSTDYTTSFFLEGFVTHNDLTSDLKKEQYFNYNIAVVPEQQASYKAGNNAFIDFLSTKCQPTINKVQKGNLKSGSISFTITNEGTISNINNNSTCGYSSVDERMMDLLNKLPEVWNVGTNGKGEKVDQTLVFSYGQMGC
jgi:hypothetical protein